MVKLDGTAELSADSVAAAAMALALADTICWSVGGVEEPLDRRAVEEMAVEACARLPPSPIVEALAADTSDD